MAPTTTWWLMTSKRPRGQRLDRHPRGAKKELDYLRTVSGIDWVGISPSYTFKPGLASDQMLVGNDHLLRNDAGESYTTAGTMAKAMVAEILHPAHHRECFTVANS